MKWFGSHFVVVLCCVYVKNVSRATSECIPKVRIPILGNMEGLVDKSVNGKIFFSFEGVPYAKPPVGKYRFKEPIPGLPWTGIWNANRKIKCMQYNPYASSIEGPIFGDEDCLYLNIYTPKLIGNFDVLAYIHAGALTVGSGVLNQPHILLDRNVVVVTLNYRLGPLGFLSTEDDVVPGNNGLKDQILALQWIKKNIRYFGGNPDSITIAGSSAGGASVHFHTLSLKSRNLFNRAISTSGCILNPWVLIEKPLERTKHMASFFGCNTANVTEMINCLKEVPGRKIVETVKKFQSFQDAPFSPFAIVVDAWSSDPILPKHPYKLLKDKKVNDVPFMLAHMANEGHCNGFKYDDVPTLKYVDDHFNEVLPYILDFNYTVEPSKKNCVSTKIRKEYLGDEHPTQQNVQKLLDLIGDRLFTSDIDKCMRLHAAAVESPVFHYLLNYRGVHSLSEIFSRGSKRNFGAVHGDDIPYIFKLVFDTLTTEQDKNMSKVLLDIFLSFASSGKPSLQDVDWTPASKNLTDPLNFLNIESPSLLSNERAAEFGNKKFWNSLPFQENEKLLENKVSK